MGKPGFPIGFPLYKPIQWMKVKVDLNDYDVLSSKRLGVWGLGGSPNLTSRKRTRIHRQRPLRPLGPRAFLVQHQ